MNQYRCETCKNNIQDDCAEWKYTSVRDVSVRCGLTCHSDFQAEWEKVLDNMIIHFKLFKNQSTFQYSAADIIQYLENFKKLESLRHGKQEEQG